MCCNSTCGAGRNTRFLAQLHGCLMSPARGSDCLSTVCLRSPSGRWFFFFWWGKRNCTLCRTFPSRQFLFFRGHYLPYDSGTGIGIAKRMATVSAESKLEAGILTGAGLSTGAYFPSLCEQKEIFCSAHGAGRARSHGHEHAILIRRVPPNRRGPQEKSKWV